MPGRPTQPPSSKKQARFYFAEAERGVPWAEEKVAKIHRMGPGSIKRLPGVKHKVGKPRRKT